MNMFQRIYVFFAALLVRALVKYCTARGRYVDYVHSETLWAAGGAQSVTRERVYMRRYVITGFMTGDKHPNSLFCLDLGPGLWVDMKRAWGRARRWFALNRWHLYLHHMRAPDADPCLHDHPWPWGVSWVLLGGYREERKPKFCDISVHPDLVPCRVASRWLQAPALNVLRGTTFHRISALETPAGLEARDALWYKGKRGRWAPEGGTWTLFLAGPRRASKPWGYLVPGRGFVGQRTRHLEMGASERRAGST